MSKLTLARLIVAVLTLVLCFLSFINNNNVILNFAVQFGLGLNLILNGVFISRISDKNKISSGVTFAVGIFIILLAIISFMKYYMVAILSLINNKI